MPNKKEEVAFLSDNFDIPPRRAAALVAADAEEEATLTRLQIEGERSRKPYSDVPIPASPEEHEVPNNGGLQKTVLMHPNKASRTGP